MRPLRDLLTTWENWSARDTLTRALSRVSTDVAREALHRELAETPDERPPGSPQATRSSTSRAEECGGIRRGRSAAPRTY